MARAFEGQRALMEEAWPSLTTWQLWVSFAWLLRNGQPVSTPAQARVFCFQSVLSVSWLPYFPSLHTRHQQVKMDPFVRK